MAVQNYTEVNGQIIRVMDMSIVAYAKILV